MAQDKTVNVQSFLNEQGFTGYQWMIFGLCFLIVRSMASTPPRSDT